MWATTRLGVVLLAVSLALPAAATAAGTVPRTIRSIAVRRPGGAVPAAPRPVVVGLTDPSRADVVRKRVEALGGTVTGRPGASALVVSTPAGHDAVTFAAELQPLPGVTGARADRIVRVAGNVTAAAIAPNDPAFDLQWGLIRIGGPAAWTAGRGAGKLIAIIDTGIDRTNPDLAPRIVKGRRFVSGPVTDFSDDHWHGTHIAGIAASVADDALGIAGTAPEVGLIIGKALDATGAGYESDVASAVVWAVDQGANVISLSFATNDARGPAPDVMGDSIAYAQAHGCVVVAAAGNTGDGTTVWPAAYDGVVAVAATEQLDRVADFSTRSTRAGGASTVLLAAPGSGIISWVPGPDLATASGTSMSTPFVSASVAIVWAANPTWSAVQVVDRLTSTALDLAPAGRDAGSGYGRVRLDAAVGQPQSPDGSEPDDSPALATSGARILPLDTPEWHNAAPAGDVDFAAVDLVGGVFYSIRTSELSGGGDTTVYLFAPDGATVLAVNDDAGLGDPASEVRVMAPYTGRYYVAVTDPRSRGGGYLLSAAVAGPRATAMSIGPSTWRPRSRRYLALSGVMAPSMPGTRVYLQVLRPGTRRWITAGSAVTYGLTYGGGAQFSLRYKPTRRGYYGFRVKYPGSALLLGSYSNSLRVRVR